MAINKHPAKQLSAADIRYIMKRHTFMPISEMSRNLKAPVHRVRDFMSANSIQAFTPPQWNAIQVEESEYFNVDARRGEYTWIV